jgi:threonine dehydrogenase-like Zn-dependent dehydrogenase
MVDSRLELAQGLGGIPINASQVHPVEAIQGYTDGIGADASIECVGLLSAVDTAIQSVRGGGTISMVGVPSAVLGDFPYMQMWMKSLTFRAGWCNVQAYMRPLLDLIAAGRVRPDSIISHRMKLDDAEEAYRIFDAREATKIVLTP